MITVWSILWGSKYPVEYVHILKRMVERNLTLEHEFVCITDQQIEGVKTLNPPTDLPGWWSKIGLFKRGVQTEKNLWLDLDVVITGSLDELCKQTNSQMRIAKNWAQSGWGGCQSSVMFWQGHDTYHIYDYFDHKDAHWPPLNKPGVMHGDQCHLTKLRDLSMLKVEYFKPGHVISYKYHCIGKLPADARVTVFHGRPDPHEVYDPWVIKARA